MHFFKDAQTPARGETQIDHADRRRTATSMHFYSYTLYKVDAADLASRTKTSTRRKPIRRIVVEIEIDRRNITRTVI